MNISKEEMPTLDDVIKASNVSLYELITSGPAVQSYYAKN